MTRKEKYEKETVWFLVTKSGKVHFSDISLLRLLWIYSHSSEGLWHKISFLLSDFNPCSIMRKEIDSVITFG